jgi:hypothetical protein
MRNMTRSAATLATAIVLGIFALSGCGGGGSGGGGADLERSTTAGDPNAAMAIGEDVALPANWPTAVPVPSGGMLNSVGVAENGNATGLWVFSSPVDAVAAEYEAALAKAGFSKVPDSEVEVEGMSGGDWTSTGYSVNVLTSDNGDGTTSLNIAANVSE